MPKKIGILTGGGDCPGLNPAIRGCVYAAEKFGYQCVGITDGWKGLVEGLAVPLNKEQVEYIIGKGGTILGTSRTNPFKKEGNVKSCLDNFKKLDLHALVAMGGEDTLGVATRFHKEYKLNVVGVPKTMDNDLNATDYTFGFDTSVTSAMEAAESLIDTGRSHHRVMVLEVMGRHAGWVALFTAIASSADYVCIPEKKINTADIVLKIKEVYARKHFALVVTSEASELEEAGESAAMREVDQFGHVILRDRGMGERIAGFIEKQTGIETRAAVIGHIQRGGAPTLFDRMLATRVGVKAAELVRDGQFGMMSALVGNKITGVPLEQATGELKTVSKDWLELMEVLF
ncbi:MAG: pyrophosphate--fructose-6-phosphate 1-phosphotransferase [Elusimicrobia bacterium GWF2_52_66]|nr:MAG: pyrophosphate--fructose-6-phosphate 1-phosphotransferase [Elusimicrobia bacterium GWA2_51_34]OGR84461.1 MAG: pyrophosphate--fructose-6-phosphate 1-phosphotransferase [Elusimicrobia bacterium GWF2_52_66]HAF94637.1 6-phosphofructokinase [Elusimicrobiota bacterium]HCE98985.1 6-phosphofructokinase [Elusimicrobiota bacterium]